MLESALGKLFHAPTARLKARAAEGDDAVELAAAMRFLFDLQELTPSRERDDATSSDENERLPN
jgi:hypothetical protein